MPRFFPQMVYPFVCAVLLVWLIITEWPMPGSIIFDPDSFGYVYPGLLMAAGVKWAGSAIRDLGYPIFIAIAVRSAGLLAVPRAQLVAVLLALAVNFAGFHLFCAAAVSDIVRRPAARVLFVTTASVMFAIVYTALLFSDDQFVFFIDALRPEAVLFLPLAGAFLLCLVRLDRPGPARGRSSFLQPRHSPRTAPSC